MNNPNLFNAAYAGVVGGAQQRWITNPLAASYSQFVQIANIVAIAVDDLIPVIVGDANSAQAALLQSIVSNVFATRLPQSLVAGDYASIASAIAALYAQASSTLQTGPVAGRTVGYTAAAPLTVTLLAAGHTPGFYAISLVNVVRTAAATGTMARTFNYSTPNVGSAVLAVSSTNLSAVPANAINTFGAYSDGVDAMTFTFTPGGVTGSPVLDLTYQAVFIGT